jgi:mRNA interferase HigB
MRVIGASLLHEFCIEHADCRKWVANWIRDVNQATWSDTHELKSRYPSASLLADGIVIFNVRGNDYRLISQIAFNVGVVAVKWIGTHAEYSKRSH